MAKVTGPLMSMTASGTVGGTITFDKRGFVRQRVIPANPQTETQGTVRQVLLAIQKALKVLGVTPIGAVKAVAPTSYRWNSFLLAAVIGSGSADFEASEAAFDALTGGQKTSWNDEGTAAGINEQTVAYAASPGLPGGCALFAVSRALFALGINTGDGAPGAANFAAWGGYFVS
jgi:hypothetical protein